MTLYEKIFKRLKQSCGSFGLEVCDHWFYIDLNFDDNGTYQLQIFYDYKAEGCRQGSETCIYTGHRKNIKKGYKKSVVRLIMQYIIIRVNYDIRKYKSEDKQDLRFKKAISQIVESCDPVTGDFYGWRKSVINFTK